MSCLVTRSLPMHRFFLSICLWILSLSVATAQWSTEDEMFGFVIGIEGKSHPERGDFVKKQLEKAGIGYFTVPFDNLLIRGSDTLDLGGEDIVVRIGRGQKRVVVGAHYDAVEDSPGANDNGGGVAVLLELVKSVYQSPMKCSVDFVFFDREENGLIGSRFYVQKVVNRNNHVAMINLDVEGTGKELYAGPVGGGDDNFLMPLVRKAALQTKFDYQEEDGFPESDYLSFADAKLENISISVVPKGDAMLLSRMAKNGGRPDPKGLPHVMRVMHTSDDRSYKMSPRALQMSFEFTRTLLRLIDEAVKAP